MVRRLRRPALYPTELRARIGPILSMTGARLKESEREKRTYGLLDSENVHSEKEKINSLFNQYKKDMLYLRNFSERMLRGYQEVFNR
jgi:hypothetical protein